jgi:hypothetical protein
MSQRDGKKGGAEAEARSIWRMQARDLSAGGDKASNADLCWLA